MIYCLGFCFMSIVGFACYCCYYAAGVDLFARLLWSSAWIVMFNVPERVNESRWAGGWVPWLSCSLMCFLRGAGTPHARPGVPALSPEST